MPATVYFGFDSAGSAYPYANYAAAETAASAGDTIIAGYCDNKQGRVWTGGITIAKDITLQGLLDRQGITFVNNGANIITCGSSCTIRNLRFGMGAYGVLANNAGYTIVVDRCAFVGTAFAVISYDSTLMTITSCYADGCYALAYFVAGAMAAKNCTAVNCPSAYNGGGLALKNCVAYGCITDYYGSPSATSCAGTHASIGTNYVDLIANDPKFWRALSSGGASDPRIQAGSALAGNGVYDAAVTLDLYGRPYANPPSRGCFEVWAIPTELAADKVLAGNDFVILDGTTRTATFDEAARNTDPGVANVKTGTNYKIQNASLSGTLIPTAVTLDYDAMRWKLTGNLLQPVYPPKAFNYPLEGLVKEPTVYGYDNQYTGTAVLDDFGPAATVVGTDGHDGGSATLTVSASPSLTCENEVFVGRFGIQGPQEWISKGTVTGNGSIATTLTEGLWICMVESLDTATIGISVGNVFWVTNAVNAIRMRIRDNVALSGIRLCKRFGFMATYESPDRVAYEVWAMGANSDMTAAMLGGETGTIRLTAYIPRQIGIPPEDGWVPGARVGVNGVWYAIDDISWETETIELSPQFTLALRRLDVSVEIDGTDV